jgi:hypothetical protein
MADRRLQSAWFGLTAALAVHVADEAMTDFLGFYNPLVRSIRLTVHWFPMPTFTFGVWLTGLVALVIVLAWMGPWVARGGVGPCVASWIFSGIMFLNGIGHLTGSVYFGRWLPGTTSAPLLLAASVWLARQHLGAQRSWFRLR